MHDGPDIFSVWLRELIVRNRSIIGALVVAGGVAGAVYTSFSGPRYRATWLARVGHISGIGVIEPAGVAAARVGEWLRDNPEAADCTWQASFVEPPESTIHLTLSCAQPDKALALAEAASRHIVERHRQLFTASSTTADACPAFLRSELTRFLGNGAPASSGTAHVSLVNDLISEVNRLEQARRLVPTFQTEIIERARLPERPAPSRLSMAIAGMFLGALLGLAGGTLRMAAPGSR